MNDFTKVELSIIHLAIIRDMTQFSHILKSSPSMIKLCDKLETMVDNYCEPINKDNPMYRCIRCESKAVDGWYEIKYGLHNWFLCIECSPQFNDWVRDKNADNGCAWAKEYFKRKYGDKNDNQ